MMVRNRLRTPGGTRSRDLGHGTTMLDSLSYGRVGDIDTANLEMFCELEQVRLRSRATRSKLPD